MNTKGIKVNKIEPTPEQDEALTKHRHFCALCDLGGLTNTTTAIAQ